MHKKIVALLLVAMMMLSVFAMTACNKRSSVSNFEIPEGGYDGSEVTLKFYHTMGSNLSDILDVYIAEFNKLYPNIKIKWEQVGGYDDVKNQIVTELNAGNEPNIAYCYPDHVAMYNVAGAVATLDDLIASDITVTRADGTTETLGLTKEQIADFIDGYYKEGQQFGDGLMYTMPFSKSTEVMYYNKTFFEANNLTVPTTWDEMETLLGKIKAIDPASIPLGYDSADNWFINMTEQMGTGYTSAQTPHFLFDDKANYEFLKKFNSWYQNGWVTTQDLYGAYTSALFTETESTRCYICIGSSAGASHQIPQNEAFEVGIAPIPQYKADQPKVISQGPSVCIFKKSNPQEVVASWLFVKYLTTSVEFQAEFSMASGYVPVIKSVTGNETYAKWLGNADGYSYLPAQSANVCLQQENAYFTSPAFNGSSDARVVVGSLLNTVLQLPAAGLDDAIAKEIEKQMVTLEAKYS